MNIRKSAAIILSLIFIITTLACGAAAAVSCGDGNHTPAEPVRENVIEPACITSGSHDEVVYCAVCGEKLSSTHVPDILTGHSDDDADGVCDKCGMSLSSATASSEEDEKACDICGATNHFGEEGSGIGIFTARNGLICRILRVLRVLQLGAGEAEKLSTLRYFLIF